MAAKPHARSRARAAVSPDPAPAGRLCSPWVMGLALALLAAAVFLPSIRNEFVNYDDPDYVTSNPQVQRGLTLGGVGWAFHSGHASNWHPLTWISHMADWGLYGDNPSGHHLTSVLLHAVNAFFCFLALRALTGSTWPAAAVALAFALHPLRVESVAWVSERKDVLSGFFFFLTLWAYARYAAGRTLRPGAASAYRKPKPATASGPAAEGAGTSPRSVWRWYLLALIAFALGLMSKPMLVTVPFLLLLLDWWPLNRIIGGSGFKAALLDKIPFLALTIASSLVTFMVQREGGAVSTSVTLVARLANAAVAYARYIGKFLWPSDLAVLYPHPGHWPAGWVIFSATALVLISAAAVFYGRRFRYLIVGWFWFLGMMVPVIGLVQVGVQSMADRYTYLPTIGLSVAFFWALYDWLAPRPGGRQALAFALAICTVAWCVLTVRQIGYWETSEKLFRRTVAVTTGNYLAYNNLGYYLANKGKMNEAIGYYEESIKINPRYEDALNNLGHARAAQRKYTEAIPCYEAALRTRPDHVEVHNNLGNALSELGRVDEAIGHYDFVLRRKPDHADAHNNLGIALAMKGKISEAMTHFREALRIRPSYASAHSNLGNAYAVQGQFDQALEHYRECLRLDPKDAQAHNNLANVLVQQGKLDQAEPAYLKALALRELNPEAHYNLGLVLVRQGKQDGAIRHLEEALRQKPDYAEARKQLDALTGATPR